MPVVIPVIVAFASGAVAAVVAGTATFAAYATVAGAVLSVAGAVTGNKDLSRIGAFVGLAGGIYNMAGGAASGAAAGIDEAATAGDYVNSADAASDAASAANSASAVDTAVAATAPVASAPITGVAAPPTVPDVSGVATPAAAPTSFAQQAAQQSGLATADAGATAASGVTPAQTAYGQLEATTQVPSAGALADAAKSYTANDLNSWWQKAMDAGKGVGKFVQNNKELVNMAGTALTNMYGPQSEALDYQKSLMERARRNINSPVVLTYQK